jgi:hypothetical protein
VGMGCVTVGWQCAGGGVRVVGWRWGWVQGMQGSCDGLVSCHCACAGLQVHCHCNGISQ